MRQPVLPAAPLRASAAIPASAAVAPSCTARAVDGSSTVVLNGSPASIPMRRIFPTIAASSGAGGLASSKAAMREKNACASMAATCSTGGVWVSINVARGGAAGGATRAPFCQAESGIRRYWSWRRCTVGKSCFPLVCVRPISQTMAVGERISFTPLGSVPCQSGPTMANAPRLVPVVRLPGDANTLVHASISGIR
ncbi:hypothetical protein D3C72_1108250 [compost metagenome]